MTTPTYSHDTFLSPFTWRYGTPAMRQIWSETHKRRTWRTIWVALATAQHELGLVNAAQLADLQAHVNDIDIARATAIEADIRHDVMAEIRTYAEQCPLGGGIIHLGATSMDVVDNADALRMGDSLDLLLGQLQVLLQALCIQIETWAHTTCMAFTHLQPAEPTTVGYRLAQYAQDLLLDYTTLQQQRQTLRGKGLKGAVGTAASYVELLGLVDAQRMEARVMQLLGIPAFTAATQVYPRKQDFAILSALAGLAASLHKFTYDLRMLQNPLFGEWSEPFGSKQVGSSAMPFKRNPIAAENIGSLARYLATLPHVAWDDAAGSILERTLDDSANRRLILPEACLTASEILQSALKIVQGLNVHPVGVARNLATYGPFAATERVLMEAVKRGGDRQALHEVIRTHSLTAWDALAQGEPNPLATLLTADPLLIALLPTLEIAALLDASEHVGDAPLRALAVRAEVIQALTFSDAGIP
jgi:adenylosuccinate lyase